MNEDTKAGQTDKPVRFPGEKITIGDQDFIVPPLNFRQLEEHAESLARLSKLSDSNDPFSDIRRALPIIHAALSRNYPKLDLADLADLVDMSNYRKVIEAVMGVSGITDAVKDRLAATGGVKPVGVASPRPS